MSLDGALIATTLPVWLLLLTMIVVGTIVPFLLLVGSLRHISATRVGVTAMFEPVAGALVAYAWLGESLSAVQLTGGAIVLDRDPAGSNSSIVPANCGENQNGDDNDR